ICSRVKLSASLGVVGLARRLLRRCRTAKSGGTMYRFALTLLFFGAGCGSAPNVPSQPLYFALEVRHQGKLVAKPKFLGEAGKVVRVERRHPGAGLPDYNLTVQPTARGDGYQLTIDLSLPEVSGHSELGLVHGEVRRIELGQKPGELQLELLMMRV